MPCMPAKAVLIWVTVAKANLTCQNQGLRTLAANLLVGEFPKGRNVQTGAAAIFRQGNCLCCDRCVDWQVNLS